MGAQAFPFNQTTSSPAAPAWTARQTRQLQVAPFVAMGSAARPLGAKSGIRVGTPSSVVSITGSGPYTWSVGNSPFGGVIDGEANAAAGPYTYSFDTPQTGTVAANGAAARQDRLDIVISDSDEGDGTLPANKGATVVYTQGAATGGALPNPPARSHKLATISVPATSGAPTIVWAPDWSGDPGEWTFNTVAERDAYVTAIGSANVPPFQSATVLADTTTSNNGTWVWRGSAWVATSFAYTSGAYTGTGIYSAGSPTPLFTAQGARAFAEGVIVSSSASFAAGSAYTIGSFPTAFAPPSQRIFMVPINTTGTMGELVVNTNGALGLIASGTFTGTLSLFLDGASWRLP